jgi:predicted ATPase/GAF domain-containing protein
MNLSEEKILYKAYTQIKSIIKNELNEIILASRNADNGKVILKRLNLHNDNINTVSKLGHEYDILKDLDHAGIPKVYDFLFDEKTVAIVQEYIDGADLRKQIFRKKLSYTEVFDVAIQLADVLSYIHEKGIIHKDINPGNIMINSDGKLKLLDFGISSNLYSETSEILNVDKIEGTLVYISPEQTGRTANSITHSSDFYSVGILLYELLAGKPPFDSIDPLEIIHFHLSRKPISLSLVLPDLPKGFDQIIFKLTEKNPDDRYHSAAGLKADLITIKKHFISREPLNNFKAGLNDITGHYKQSQKLYGRENEIGELLGYFKNLSQLKSMLVLVAGYSGVGKSALIRHIKFPIVQSGGTFISGKFDQFKKDIPYYAFIEAIKEFIKHLLTEPEEKINEWRNRISLVLGDNARLITDVIPQLSKIVENQPAVPKLQPAEQEARFNMVILDFIYAFSSTERPLVVFLDDLQWADLPSLNLVKRILENPREDRILIIGSYRDNEVDKGHPLLITLKQISESKGLVKSIHLQPLNIETTVQITADSFDMEITRATELGRHVYIKTKGNPFFIHSFLKSLFDRRLVKYDTIKNWTWNQDEIDNLEYTNNVIDLMTDGLIDLPGDTQEILKYAAVLGNTFDLADLSDITGKTQPEVYTQLKPAIKGGYLNSIDTGYRSLAISAAHTNTLLNQQFQSKTAQFIFTHDKVQQAAYNLIATSELGFVHLKIGRLLLQNRTEQELNDDIFELLNHFVNSSHLIENRGEKEKIAELCLIAGRKAKESTSYSFGVIFLEMAVKLLGSNSWNENYELTYNVLIELGECEYLNNNPENAERYFKEILGYAKTRFEKLKVYYIHSSLYLKIGNTSESLRLGLDAAKLYNIHFPKNKTAIQVATMFALTKYLFLFSTKYKNPENVFNLKDCNDEEIIALNKFLIDLATSAYQQDQNLMMLVIFKIVESYLKHGFTDASGWGFSGFSVVVLSALKMQKRGFKLWDITKKLHQRTNSPLIKWRLSYTVLSFNSYWRRPIREGHESMLETIKACVLNGDQIFTGYTVALSIRSRFSAGVALNEIMESSEDHLPLIKNIKGGMDFYMGFYQLVKALNGQTNENSWDDISFNGDETLEHLNQEGNMTKLAIFHSARFYFLYYFKEYETAIDESKIVAKYADNFLGDVLEGFHAFYTSLAISAHYEKMQKHDQKKYLNEFKRHLKNLKFWTKGSPENYNQHYHLLQAELYAIENKFEKAVKYYEKSIELAAQNNFIYVEAIANERAALLCDKAGMFKQSNMYLEYAWDAYNKWGAYAICKKLENTWPKQLKAKIAANTNEQHRSSALTSMSSKTALDLASVLKASQSIASQVKYEGLLKNLMHITIENAGAEKGCLLLYKENQLCIEAVSISGSESIEILPSVPLNQMQIMPNSILNYCWRSEESVVIDDAVEEARFSADPYIQENNVLSVMCLPISALGKINGLLYLENRLLKGVFNKNRIELLQMLSGQIGISIENAILYENLEGKVVQRTKEIGKALTDLKATQSQLIQSEKMASLGELTAGIAHEIQNPLNFVNNFSELSNELLREMKEELATGNVQLVNELADDVIQNLQKINHHGKRAADIVKGMLQHSRTSSGQKEPTDMNVLADEYLRLAFHGLKAKDKSFNADFKTDLDHNLPKINVIPQDIGRVLLNLINNAFYAVDNRAKNQTPPPPKGGIEERGKDYVPTVTISTAFQNPPSGGRGVKITVKDNGEGIPAHIVDKIFQPFFTTKPSGKGTGLGLSLSYDIVKAHGGELKVETKEGEGSTFIIHLPIDSL